RRNTQVGCVAAGESERAALQPAQIQREAVALPREDLQAIPATIAEDEQIAAERVPAEVRRHEGRQAVDALAPILRLAGDPDPPGEAKGQHAPPPKAAMSRAITTGSVPIGTRTTSPVGRMTSAVASGTTRTAAKAGAVRVVLRARAARRLRQA